MVETLAICYVASEPKKAYPSRGGDAKPTGLCKEVAGLPV